MSFNEDISHFAEAPELKKTVTYLLEIETLAQEILTERRVQIALADKHNKLREAFRAIQQFDGKTVSMKFGNVYMDFSNKTCSVFLKDEMDKVGREVEEKRQEIKEMLQKMRDLEHQPGIVGFSIKPLTGAEVKVICKKSGYSNLLL